MYSNFFFFYSKIAHEIHKIERQTVLIKLNKIIDADWNLFGFAFDTERWLDYSNKPNRQLRLVTPLFLTATIT